MFGIKLRKNKARALIFLGMISLLFSFNNCKKMEFATAPEELQKQLYLASMISINNDDAFTNSQDVIISVANEKADQVYITNDPLCNSGGVWEPLSKIKPWRLQGINSLQKVYARFRSNKDKVESECASDSIIEDSQAPIVEVQTQPARQTNESMSIVTFIAKDALSLIKEVECLSSQNSSFTSCIQSFSQMNISEGTQSLQIRAKDIMNNISDPVSVTWIFDKTPPVIQFTQTPALLSGNPVAMFRFTGSDKFTPSAELTFSCSVDGGVAEKCSDSFSKNVGAGSHKFTLIGKDIAGNESLPIEYTWSVDLDAPSVSINTFPLALTNSSNGNFTFSGTDGGSPIHLFDCQIDNKGFIPCNTGTTSYSSLTEGTHTFQVKGYDSVGNASAPVSYSWTVDLTPPSVLVNGSAGNVTGLTSNSFSISGTDNNPGALRFFCSLDGGSEVPCVSGFSISGLLGGTHTLNVRAQDSAGNYSAALPTSWLIDLIPPTVEILTTPLAINPSSSATFTFRGADNSDLPVKFQCKLDTELAFSDCSSGINYTQLLDATHIFSVKAIDSVGNVSPTATYSWSSDTTGPKIIYVQVPNAKFNMYGGSLPALSYTVTDPNTVTSVTCQIDSNPAQTCVAVQSLTLSGLVAGLHTYTIVAKDSLGNTSTNSISWEMINNSVLVKQTIDLSYSNKVDVLMVIDNSGSMLTKQQSMADRFSNFIGHLATLDWQMAMTTTDLGVAATPDAPLTNGRLIELTGAAGQYILTSSMNPASVQSLFKSTIVRPEVGSSDEQGIAASYRVLERSLDPSNPINVSGGNTSFVRSDAALAIIVVSDADETPGPAGTGPKNIPGNLLTFLNTSFPKKPFSFHSIIVKPNDATCLNNQWLFNEGYGISYDNLAKATGGIVGSVCEWDYGQQLSDIGAAVTKLVRTIQLQCAPIDTTGDGVPDIKLLNANLPAYTLNGASLTLSQAMKSGNYDFQYSCLP